MKKLMLLAAMLAMVLAAAAPAFAQITNEPDVSTGANSNLAFCQNLFNQNDLTVVQVADQNIEQDQTAVVVPIGVAANVGGVVIGDQNAEVNQDVAISQEAQQELNQTGISNEVAQDCAATINVTGPRAAAAAPAAAAAAAAAPGAAAAAAPAARAALPATGGASLIALGAGALLVAGGLVARRVIR